jgi:hypothetical protein
LILTFEQRFSKQCARTWISKGLLWLDRGSTWKPPPFYDPDKNYINKDMDEAISRARALGLSIAPHLDPATMVWIFVDAQREIINSLRPKT